MDTGDTAWVLTSAALVLFMTPGLALFYGGMVRSKNVLGMLMKNYISMGVITVVWLFLGYSLAFGGEVNIGGFNVLGNLDLVALGDMGLENEIHGYTIPDSVFMVFQMMFAIITPALISGAVAERMKFSAWVVFIVIWSLLVYAPMAHWVWGGGFIFSDVQAVDFAGGLVVHINAGVAALALVLVLGPRLGWRSSVIRPHNLPLTLLGAGMLWFGWFGFNAGSALGASGGAGNAFVTTQVAAAVAATAWALMEQIRQGSPTTLGVASGAVAGLVAITPAAGFVEPHRRRHHRHRRRGDLLPGSAAQVQVQLRRLAGRGRRALRRRRARRARCSASWPTRPSEASRGGVEQLGRQALSVGIAIAYSFIISYALARILDATMGLRVSEDAERRGIDISLHDEQSYVLSE